MNHFYIRSSPSLNQSALDQVPRTLVGRLFKTRSDSDSEDAPKRARTVSRKERLEAKRGEREFEKLCAVFRRISIYKEEEMSTVKCKLSQLFLSDPIKRAQQQLIKEEIERSVRILQQIQMEAWHLANFHLLRCLETHNDLDESKHIMIPNLDCNFFNRCISGVGIDQFTPSEGNDSALNETIGIFRQEREQQIGYQRPTIVNWDTSKSAMGLVMKTNARNMIVLHFYRRLARYVRLRYVLSTAGLAHNMIREAFQQYGPHREVAMVIREWLTSETRERNIERDPTHFVIKLYEMLRYMERHQDEDPNIKGNRVFSLLPASTSFVPAHIAISSSVLHQIWLRIRQHCEKETKDSLDPFKNFLAQPKRGVNMRVPTNKEFQLFRDAVWREHFDISKFETNRWKFAHYITTNGYEVSVLRKRDVIGGENPFLSTRQFDPKIARDFSASKIIGIDPGMRVLCTVASVHMFEDDMFLPRTYYRFRKKKRINTTRTAKWKRKCAPTQKEEASPIEESHEGGTSHEMRTHAAD